MAAIQENIEEIQFQNLRALMYRSLVRLEVASFEDADYYKEDDESEEDTSSTNSST